MLLDFNEKTEKWEVKKKYHFVFDKTSFTIEKGFESDLASVPRLLWWIFPPFGKYAEPSVVHDWFYKYKKLPKKKADRLFLIMMIEKDTNIATAILFYVAVLFSRRYGKEN